MPLKDGAHTFDGGGVNIPKNSFAIAVKKRKKNPNKQKLASLEPELNG